MQEYFAAKGSRSYEDKIYANLGEFYLAKLRYDDAAKTYKAFVALNPFHRSSPHFSMRVVEIYGKGNFPKLVLEAKKEFASKYGLQSEYWRHFDVNESPEVLSYLKSNLKDLANHHHAQYQNAELVAEKPANYAEALRWYREYLVSFPKEADTPPINYQLADLLLENEAFGEAALEYERTAYDYPVHAKSAAAGYAAIFAHRQNLKTAPEELRTVARTNTVTSSLRFADTFPTHEHAATVLGAAADDLYEMKDFRPAIAAAQKLIERYPGAAARRSGARPSPSWRTPRWSSPSTRRPSRPTSRCSRSRRRTTRDARRWSTTSRHRSTSRASRPTRRRTIAPPRITSCASSRRRPTSQIRAAAEYDAAAALIQLQDWVAAAGVLEAFRSSYPDHELNREATKQIAYVYRQNGQLSQAAGEYERVASESSDPNLRGEALLVAGDLYEQSGSMRAGACRIHALRRAVPAADRHRGRDALQDRGDAPGGARRAALSAGAAADRPHRRGSRRRTHEPHAHGRSPLCARALGAALSPVRRGRSCASRSRRASRRRSGSWTPRWRPSGSWSTTR